jgi:muramoyltetrapeptide carboxypeptidase
MIPPFLSVGNRIRIVSPSGAINREYTDGAKLFFEKKGFEVIIGENANNKYGRFAGTEAERISDLQKALDDPETKAILCSRGGYGLSQIIDKLDFSGFLTYPKWLIGFSDITILHSAINRLGFASLHSIMAKHITELPSDCEEISHLSDILKGSLPVYNIPAEAMNRYGKTSGILTGGNLSVLAGLRGTPYEPQYAGKILLIEDISEKPYHIDRMIQNLRLGGILESISGLIVGQFSDCEEDPLMQKTIAEIIRTAVEPYNYPVCFNFPVGHVDNNNLPVILGTTVCLDVSEKGAELLTY